MYTADSSSSLPPAILRSTARSSPFNWPVTVNCFTWLRYSGLAASTRLSSVPAVFTLMVSDSCASMLCAVNRSERESRNCFIRLGLLSCCVVLLYLIMVAKVIFFF